MTIHKLIKSLQEIEKKIGPRARVTINFREVEQGISGGFEYSHWEINCIDAQAIPWAIDDSIELKDGSERMRTVVVLS